MCSDFRFQKLGVPAGPRSQILDFSDFRFQTRRPQKSGWADQVTKRADYIPRTTQALQPENCMDLVMCEISKAPKMRLQSALKSANAAFSWVDGRCQHRCEISGRPQHITNRADYIPKTREVLQPENCLNLVMCEITKAPDMKLQSALKSASAAFSRVGGR